MVVFEMYINGKMVYTAGVGDEGVLMAVASWSRHRVGSMVLPDQLNADIRGFDTKGFWLTWPSFNLSIGDEVCIKVVEQDHCDAPAQRHDVPFENDCDGENKYCVHGQFQWSVKPSNRQ